MFKQGLIYFVLSVLTVVFAKYMHAVITYIAVLYAYTAVHLKPLFSTSEMGVMVRQVLTLVLLPVGIVGMPALLYWTIKRTPLPHFMEIIWLVWLIIVLSKILIH